MRKDEKKKKRRICKIVVDVASRKWREKKVKYKTDGLSNEKMNKWRKNKSDRVDNIIVEKDCNCYQLKIFTKKVSMGQKKQRRSE